MSPRKRRAAAIANDWRTPEQVAHDRALVGTWWRCEAHGLTHDPLVLGDVTYCPVDDCTHVVVLVHRVSDDKKDGEWNDGPGPRSPRAAAADHVELDTDAAPSEAAESGAQDDALGDLTPEDTEDDMGSPHTHRPTNAEIITNALAARTPPEMPARELRAIFVAARSDLGDRATANFDATAQRLRAVGRLVRTAAGWALPGAAPAAAPTPTRDEGPHRSPTGPLDAEPAAPRERSRSVRDKGSPLDASTAPLVADAPRATIESAPSTTDTVQVRVTGPMRRRLEELLAEGFCGHTVEEVAERFLARALRAFTTAN